MSKKSTSWGLLLLCVMLVRVLHFCSFGVRSCEYDYLKRVSYVSTTRGVQIGFLDALKKNIIDRVEDSFESPNSQMILGTVLGVDTFREVPEFKNKLRETGTIHVVVVSGYNISLVNSFIIRIFGKKYRIRNLILSQSIVLLYSILTGFQPPVVRAWVMNFFSSIGHFFGRRVEILRLLLLTAFFMLLWNPLYILSISFQLSFLATLGLILYQVVIQDLVYKAFGSIMGSRRLIIVEDFSCTIAAQILVFPIIANAFGTFSTLGVLVNTIVLWTIPYITMLGSVYVIMSFISDFASYFVNILVKIPLYIFVEAINYFGKFDYGSMEFEMSSTAVLVYYFVVFLLTKRFLKNTRNPTRV